MNFMKLKFMNQNLHPITAIAESGNSNTCLVSSSSSEWVIVIDATNHMIGNSNMFSTF